MKKIVLILCLAGVLPASTLSVPRALAAPAEKGRQVKWASFRQSSSKKVVPEVKAIQFLLRARGFYKAQPDGIFGPQTAAAVKAFQRSKGLKADGIVGAATFPQLVRVLKRGDRGDAVRAAQLLGRDAADHIGGQPYLDLKIDGIYGARTEDAIEFFQGAVSFPEPVVGLDSTGKVDLTTWKVMFGA